jgi:hypothetical protein
MTRFGVTESPKRFVRTYYEIKHSKYKTNYIPNFDDYTIEQMSDVLRTYFKKSTDSLTPETIEFEFKKRINKQARDLLTDVQNFS